MYCKNSSIIMQVVKIDISAVFVQLKQIIMMKNNKIAFIIVFVLCSPYRAFSQSADHNYVKTITYLDKDGLTSDISIQYYDAFGYPEQLIKSNINTEGTNILVHTSNNYGKRSITTWAPIVVGKSVDYFNQIDVERKCAETYEQDRCPYSISYFDEMERQTRITTMGGKWNGRGKNYIYRGNNDKEVKRFTLSNLGGTSYYGSNSLDCVEYRDEDEQSILTFKDFNGNLVLERRIDGNQHFDTYYVYDNYCRLSYVLPPEYSANPKEEALSKYAYVYTYDERGRIRTKSIPGCDSIRYWYDKANRVVKMQDGVLRTRGKYRVYTYDALGRLTNQSISDGDRVEYDEVVNFYDTYDYLKNPQYADMVPTNNVDTTSLCPFHPKNGYGQLTGTWQRASNGEDLLMSYNYDDYGRLTMTKEIGLDKHLSVDYHDYNFNGTIHNEHKDLYRYCKTEKALNDNSLWGWISNKYHPSNNKMLRKSVIHLQHKGSEAQTYDEIMKPTYDDFGRMIANDRSGTAGDMTFRYDNLHGWLTQVASTSGFRQSLYRENSDYNPRFNGTISAMSWRVGDSYNRTYHYDYDKLNRLKTAEYSSWLGDWTAASTPELRSLIPMYNNEDEGDYSVYYEYDLNTNIIRIDRYGASNTEKDVEIDELTLTYNGNQLKSVYDNSAENLTYAGAFDFHDEVNSSVEYAYNENGAMTKDLNKGITNIEYDLLGNPRKVTFSDQNSIEYVYAADGRKLREVHSLTIRAVVPVITDPRRPGKGLGSQKIGKGTNPKGQEKLVYYTFRDSTDYINNYVFKNGKPEMYRFNGGYYSFDSNGNMNGCHFYVQDYQGNNRMVVNAYTDEVEQINHYYPYGALMGDISTQPEKQDFKYSGKELDRTYGLDLYDFEARQQDPLVGRFTSIDPKAEKYYSISPYAYCAGDPINLIDPTGCSTQVVYNDSTNCYDVVGGDINDNDLNIYICVIGEDGQIENTEEILGVTPTMTSFYNSDTKKFSGSINPNDNSGITFISDIMDDTPDCATFFWNARNDHRFDFKSTNGEDKPIKGINHYRGMPFGVNSEGQKIFTSARDIGNMAAGYVARKNGWSWKTVRFWFDLYQSYPSFHYEATYSSTCPFVAKIINTPEGVSSQNAQKYGYYHLFQTR